jgi:hypothetical protein
MVGPVRMALAIIVLTVGCATGTLMAIEDFDLLGSATGMDAQDANVREVGPLYFDGEEGECDKHDGQCGNTDQVGGAACGTGQGCC